MDPSLMRQQLAFQQHAARTVSVQNRPQASDVSHTTYNSETAKKKKKTTSSHHLAAGKSNTDFDYKTATSHSNAANFSTMAKIVDYMKKRHLNNQQWGLKLSEILDEIQVFDLSKRSEAWLREALPANPKLQLVDDDKFTYQPPHKIKGKQSLLAVATKHHQDAKGGILLSSINECIPNAEKVIESMGKDLIVVPTQVNKRKDKVVFFNDPACDFEVDDEFKALWRSVSVDHLDEKKIEEYLQKHGIDAMKDLAPKKSMAAVPKRKAPKRRQNGKVHNEHLNDVLEDY